MKNRFSRKKDIPENIQDLRIYRMFKICGLISIILTSAIIPGCTLFDEENPVSVPKAVIINEGVNEEGIYVVRVIEIDRAVRARNVEVAFIDTNGDRVDFFVGRTVSGITLDNIYFSDVNPPNRNFQVVYYDFDDDQRLAGNPVKGDNISSNFGRDYFLIHPKLGAKDPDDPDYSIANFILVLLWKDDNELDENARITDELTIGKTTILREPDTNATHIDEASSEENNKYRNVGFIVGIILLTFLGIIVFVIINTRNSAEKSIKKEHSKEIESNLEVNEEDPDLNIQDDPEDSRTIGNDGSSQ